MGVSDLIGMLTSLDMWHFGLVAYAAQQLLQVSTLQGFIHTLHAFNSGDTYKVHPAVYRTLQKMVYYTGGPIHPAARILTHKPYAIIFFSPVPGTSCEPAGWSGS